MMCMHCDSVPQTHQERSRKVHPLWSSSSCRPALVLLTSTGMSRDGYQGRISVNERHVTLSTGTGSDEGSYTVRDAEGVIQSKICLNVRGESTNEDLYLFFSHAWPVLNGRHLPSGYCCFLSSYSAPVVCHNGFLKTLTLMGSSRLMHFRWSMVPVNSAVLYLSYVLPPPLSVSQSTKTLWPCHTVTDWRSTWYSTAPWSVSTTPRTMIA